MSDFERFFKQNGAQQLFKADGEGRAKKTRCPEREREREREMWRVKKKKNERLFSRPQSI